MEAKLPLSYPAYLTNGNTQVCVKKKKRQSIEDKRRTSVSAYFL